MAQTTILSAGTNNTYSSDITLAQGETRTVGIFSASAIPEHIGFQILIDTPQKDMVVGSLCKTTPALVISGPGTFRVMRPDISNAGVDVGVYTEG
jgi:hypothetical protein